ncbi:MAG TPA: hypothetical protein VF516_00435 [Kofleriaceae bacterium]
MVRLVAIAILLASTAAHADSDTEGPPGQAVPDTAAAKSEDTALGLSAVGPFASAGVLMLGVKLGNGPEAGTIRKGVGGVLVFAGGAGILLGPSFGEFYAGKYLTGGMGLRLGGLGVMGLGAIAAALARGFDCRDLDCPKNPNTSGADAVIVVGAVLYGAGWIYDVANARATVREYNRAHGSLRAMLVPTGNGVAVAGTF